jgi:hypothetical protein
MARTHLYTIRPGQDVFDAGVLPDGQQVLVGFQLPELVVVRFSSQGVLTGVEVIATVASDNGSAAEQASIELIRWKSEIGFRATAITVEPFFLRDRWIGIADLPQHYQEVLDHPESLDEVRRWNLLDDIRQWRLRGDFVLYWDEDYYLNTDGEVVSS